MDTIIEVSHLKKTYGAKVILKDVSFSVKKGEIFGLIGPFGAGKTTLINILTGQSNPTDGGAAVWGESCTSLSKKTYQKIGMALDFPALFERLSCKQNLNIYATIFNVDNKKVTEVLQQVGLQEEENKAAWNLSKGMRQRLILARALLHSPDLLFLDEPTSALDPRNSQIIREIIKDQQRQGVTVFLTTHRMDEVMKLCDRVSLLYNGIILEEGSPEEICRKYDSDSRIRVKLSDGSILTLPKNEDAYKVIAEYAANGTLRSVDTSGPDLEDVFLYITREGQDT